MKCLNKFDSFRKKCIDLPSHIYSAKTKSNNWLMRNYNQYKLDFEKYKPTENRKRDKK